MATTEAVPPKILVIDDDGALLETAARLLELGGFRVTTYAGHFNRLFTVLQERPDLVLLDVNMPFLSGDELLALMRADPQLKDIPVALFSSNDEGELRRMARDMGACGYVPKSSLGLGLAGRVRKILTGSRGI